MVSATRGERAHGNFLSMPASPDIRNQLPRLFPAPPPIYPLPPRPPRNNVTVWGQNRPEKTTKSSDFVRNPSHCYGMEPRVVTEWNPGCYRGKTPEMRNPARMSGVWKSMRQCTPASPCTGDSYSIFSTWLKPSSTGVSRPKMLTSTLSFCVSGLTSDTTAGIVAKGPSITVTDSPTL